MQGLFFILLFYLLGMLFSHIIGGFIPGSVIGMVLLFASLCAGVVKAETVRGASRFMADNLALFFVPVCVGIMEAYTIVGGSLAAVIFSSLASTLIVLAVVGYVAQYVERRRK